MICRMGILGDAAEIIFKLAMPGNSYLLLEPISKMRLSAQGCVAPRIEILTYCVYAPFPIRGTPCPEPLATIFKIGSSYMLLDFEKEQSIRLSLITNNE